MPPTHPLRIQPIWYDEIASGQKRWEGRLNSGELVTLIRVSDLIEFSSDDRPPLYRRVVQVQHFPDFEKMLDGGWLQRLLPGVASVEEGLEIYRGFPGYREGEREFGAVVFELEKVAGL